MSTPSTGPRVDLAYVEETEHGTTPGSPTMKLLPATMRNINPAKNEVTSERTYTHRQMKSIRHGMHSVEGAINAELSKSDYDDFLALGLSGAWTGDVLKMGNTMKTWTVERRFTDIDQYQVFRGVTLNQLEVQIQPERPVMLNGTLLGMAFNDFSATEIAAPAAAVNDPSITSFDGKLTEGTTELAIATGLNFTVANNRTLEAVIGSYTSPTVFEGQGDLTGQLTLMFEDAAAINKFANETESKLVIELDSISGDVKYTITIPRVKYMGGAIDPPRQGPNILTLPFRALYDATEETQIKIVRALTT